MDKVYVEGMEFYGYHGVFEEENKLGQRFKVDLTAELDLSKAGQTDDLSYTINGVNLTVSAADKRRAEPVNLVETLAERIADTVLKKFEPVRQCTVKVIKPDPPIPRPL